jgi:hypothetical protein
VRARGWAAVRGNHEFYYLDFGTPRAAEGSDDAARWGALHWLMDRLSAEQGEYLALLPDERTLYFPGTHPLGIAHGVPGRNRAGFYPDQSPESIAADLGNVTTSTFVSAHTHVQLDRQVERLDGRASNNGAELPRKTNLSRDKVKRLCHVINPGSVGLPLNQDTRAQFALLESVPEDVEPGGWAATHVRVEYDRRAMLDAYATSGMAAAGGVITQLFYWELVTADTEIVLFYHWARGNNLPVDDDMPGVFLAYCQATQRHEYVRARDPLFQAQIR